MNPVMGLTSYAAFMKAGATTMVMGDTTILEDQVNPVMSVALDSGLEVTALSQPFFLGHAQSYVHAHRWYG